MGDSTKPNGTAYEIAWSAVTSARHHHRAARQALFDAQDELDSVVTAAFREMSFGPIERLFIKVEAAEDRLRAACLSLSTAEGTLGAMRKNLH